MPDAPPLPGIRHDWLGRLLDACSPAPGIGSVCRRAQRVRRKKFRARLGESGAQHRHVLASAPGRAFQTALDGWFALPPLDPIAPPLAGVPRDPAIRCSVVINTVDRARDLAITLSDLAKGWRGREDELIIVLGPTTDDSRVLAARCGIPCRLIDCPERNLSISRNLGLAAAAGNYTAFLDDDASPCDGWLDALLDPLVRDPSAGASAGFALDGAGGRYLTRYVISDRLGRSVWLDREDEAMRHLDRVGGDRAFLTATGCNMAFHREHLLAIGGFDPAYAYFLEETDLVLRLAQAGHPCIPCPQSTVRHRQGLNMARSPDATVGSRRVMLRSQLHFVRKHGARVHPRAEIESCVWHRVLCELERIAWDHPHSAGRLQEAYLAGACGDLGGPTRP